MAYLTANHFELGLDLRKSAVTAPPSSFRDLRNCVINSGGGIQRRKAFVKIYTITDPKVIGGIAGDNANFYIMTKTGARATPLAITGPLYSLGIDTNAAITRFDSYQPWSNGFVISGDTGDQLTRKIYYNGALVTYPNSQSWGARVFGNKVYAVNGQVLNFSASGNPGNWDPTVVPANGSSFITIPAADQFSGTIVGLDRYYKQLAVFGVNDIQIWNLDPDPNNNDLAQTLGNTGLIAHRAKAQYSSGDVLYLTRAGIRSLKARDASNYAITDDVGSPVDSLVKAYLISNLAGSRYQMQGVVDPETGNFWMTMGTQILVFSFYPTSKISAWSLFDLPFSIDDIAVNREAVAVRSGADIYIYGGLDHASYDQSTATVLTPFLDAGSPGVWKQFLACQIGCDDTWAMGYNVNPNSPGAIVPASTAVGSTYQLDTVPMQAQGTHLQLQLTSSSPTPAILSSFSIHYNETKGG